MSQCTLGQRLGGHAAVFLHQVLLQRAAVDAHTDWNIPLPAGVGHGPHAVLRPDVAGVDAYFIHTAVHTQQRQPVIKVDIRHQRDVYSRLDARNGPCGLLRGHRHTHDLAARLLQAVYLPHCGVHVLRGRIAHGLYAYGRAAAHRYRAHLYASCHRPRLLSGSAFPRR